MRILFKNNHKQRKVQERGMKLSQNKFDPISYHMSIKMMLMCVSTSNVLANGRMLPNKLIKTNLPQKKKGENNGEKNIFTFLFIMPLQLVGRFYRTLLL